MRADSSAVRALRVTLLVLGVIFIFGVYPLTRLWPSGWAWTPSQSEYLQMILAIYATLGVFLLRAAREPLANLSLIWFTVWSSVVHAAVMAVQALRDPAERGHLPGDVLVLLLVGIGLAFVTMRATGGSGLTPRTAQVS
jgi:hypothetical protein